MRGGHLAILRSGFGATKESEVAVGDIVPVSGESFEQTLASASPDVLREMVREFAQRMMDADVEVRCNAGYGEMTPDRVNSRNGYRRREWDTRAGTIELAIPKLRQGSYYPEWLLKRRRRAERALATSPDSPVNDLGDQQGVRDLDRLHRPAVPLDG
jgi:GH24 family phage-related lysozyme (muramidase)